MGREGRDQNQRREETFHDRHLSLCRVLDSEAGLKLLSEDRESIPSLARSIVRYSLVKGGIKMRFVYDTLLLPNNGAMILE